MRCQSFGCGTGLAKPDADYWDGPGWYIIDPLYGDDLVIEGGPLTQQECFRLVPGGENKTGKCVYYSSKWAVR